MKPPSRTSEKNRASSPGSLDLTDPPAASDPVSVDTLRTVLTKERHLLEQSRAHIEQHIARLEAERLVLLAKQLKSPAVDYMMAFPPTHGVFVTVGTTRFDALVNEVCTVELLATLRSKGYTSVTLQHGNSPLPVLPSGMPIPVTAYAFKPDLTPDISTAALVISHAGAGLILESLDAGKPLIVVVNRALMDDHQTELAVALAEKEVLVWTDVDGLVETVEQGGYAKLKTFGKADPSPLIAVLEQEAGFQ
ncbi:N-acetylglucosaminyldiphosphodolichol N-acetylglucosaminyltransferase catalytic subunit alg13 [Geranomyces michiganensis]|nr:N-acetylglucosaminyldiphosphodolichol N-acetylglucosaminyltransferase catalytic subunit alg13 [Geranomyces michiganensis]